MLGIFDYVKVFFVVIIYASFFDHYNQFRKMFDILLKVAVVLGIIVLFQEVWALGSIYIFGRELSDQSVYLFSNVNDMQVQTGYWRFGIFRAPSLLVSTTTSGLYALLIFNLYLFREKRVSFVVVASLLFSIFASISRIVYCGFLLISGIHFFRHKRWLIIFLIPLLLVVYLMGGLWDLNLAELITNIDLSSESSIELSNESLHTDTDEIGSPNDVLLADNRVSPVHFREYSRGKAMEIWKNHPFWGAGFGMFGGVISLSNNSHIYEEYAFKYMNYLRLLRSIDNFWPQLLAEGGIVGAAFFIGIIVTLFIMLHGLGKVSTSEELKAVYAGLAVYLIVIMFYTVGMGLNVTAVFFTYCALMGMSIGCIDNA
jgi:hypothetical protein